MFVQLERQGSLQSVLSHLNMLEVYIGSFSRWIFTSLVILTLLQYCESISWTKQPAKPMILVVGVNNTNQTLSWLFIVNSGETVQNIQLQRSKPGGADQVTLASRLPNTGFSYEKEEYKNEYIAQLDNELVLKNVNNDEEFVYKILVIYVEGSKVKFFSDEIQVIVKVPPKITVSSENYTGVNIGTNVTLTCNASGDPLPIITWTKEGVPAAQFDTTGYWLHLVNVQRRDFGYYKCTADNGYGTATRLAFIGFILMPRITVSPKNYTRVNIGTNVTLTCNASGDPLPKITWTKESVPEAQFNVTGYWLHLVNVQRQDVGSYKCTADNGHGTATSLAVVDLIDSSVSIIFNGNTTSASQLSTRVQTASKFASASLSTTAAYVSPTANEPGSAATRATVKGVKIAVIAGVTTLFAIMREFFL